MIDGFDDCFAKPSIFALFLYVLVEHVETKSHKNAEAHNKITSATERPKVKYTTNEKIKKYHNHNFNSLSLSLS